jgi:4-oxalocrotonate tautomerase
MPFVNIQILKGHSKQRKDEISRRVTEAIAEVAGLSKDAVWIVYEDVETEDWYCGGKSMQDVKAAQAQSTGAQSTGAQSTGAQSTGAQSTATKTGT